MGNKKLKRLLIFAPMYKIFRAVLFMFDPEWVHYFSMNFLRFFCRLPPGKKLIAAAFCPKEQNLQTTFLKMSFANPVGLGAGFDKNARYLNEMEALGFGFVEIGTVTPQAQAGNDKPRLFRLVKDKALINRMGFNNEGVEAIAVRLKKWKDKQALEHDRLQSNGRESKIQQKKLIVGGNIGKNKITPNEDAWKDYVVCFNALHDYVDYFVVNVSSPNTPGLRELQEKESLRKIFTELQNCSSAFKNKKPVFLKIAPDLTPEQIDDVIGLALEIQIDGLVAANTTITREGLLTHHEALNKIGAGGLSGLPLKENGTGIVKYIYQKTNGRIPVIASGGIFTGSDAKEKLDGGAKLVQVWTGFIYEGPGIVKNICKALATHSLNGPSA